MAALSDGNWVMGDAYFGVKKLKDMLVWGIQDHRPFSAAFVVTFHSTAKMIFSPGSCSVSWDRGVGPSGDSRSGEHKAWASRAHSNGEVEWPSFSLLSYSREGTEVNGYTTITRSMK